MKFHEGDTVMHWTYGLGQILGVEERDLFGSKKLYYAVLQSELITRLKGTSFGDLLVSAN